MADLFVHDQRAGVSAEDGAAIETTLGLLNAIGSEEPLTQRSLAVRLGVALGLANALVKRCVKKGLVKVQQVPARRFAYYLTSEGFREKSRLVGEYLSCSLNFFRRARGEYAEALSYCERRGWKRVALYGASELAEIATVAAHETEVKLVGIVDSRRNSERLGGVRIVSSLDALGEIEAVIVTDAAEPQAVFERLIQSLPPERVLTPKLLHVARKNTDGHAEAAA